jgi:hypothetical protein
MQGLDLYLIETERKPMNLTRTVLRGFPEQHVGRLCDLPLSKKEV